jgi:hypothetical protein
MVRRLSVLDVGMHTARRCGSEKLLPNPVGPTANKTAVASDDGASLINAGGGESIAAVS